MRATIAYIVLVSLLPGCGDPKIDELDKRVLSCAEFPAAGFFSAGLQTPGEIPIDSVFAKAKLTDGQSACLSGLKASAVELLTDAGKPAGYLLHFSDSGYILYRSFSGWQLSPRYRIKRKLSDNLFIVKFIG